jgi:hypothetical protein
MDSMATQRLIIRRFKPEDWEDKPVYFKKTKEGTPIWHDAFEYAILDEEWFSKRNH